MRNYEKYNKACQELGIDTKDDITIGLLKKQYRMNCLRYHPDKCKLPDASSKFQEIQNAYEYLLKHLEFENIDDIDMEDYDSKYYTKTDKNGYAWILETFLRNLMSTENINKNLFHIIVCKISSVCENKALETLEKIEKTLLIKIYDIVKKYREAFHFSNDFFDKLNEILSRKMKDDECIILNPTMDDLFSNNLYKLKVGDFTYIVPLWNHELVYDNSGSDIYVKCIPITDENIDIDEYNNIHVELNYPIEEIWGKESVDFSIENHGFSFSPSNLRLLRNQVLVLKNQGISKMNSADIYDISRSGDIILHIGLTFTTK
jgi:DnaJ-class molecular chaperone